MLKCTNLNFLYVANEFSRACVFVEITQFVGNDILYRGLSVIYTFQSNKLVRQFLISRLQEKLCSDMQIISDVYKTNCLWFLGSVINISNTIWFLQNMDNDKLFKSMYYRYNCIKITFKIWYTLRYYPITWMCLFYVL